MKTLGKKSPTQEKWVMLTAYDALMAKQVEEGGADIILVGDSLGKAILGYKGVEEVTLNDMLHHCKAVLRGRKSIPVVGDLPVNSYGTKEQALKSSEAFMKIGVDFVKLEGYLPETITFLANKKIPVIAHLGHTPQTATHSGTKVVANELKRAEQLLQECLALEQAGVVGLVLEMVTREVAKTITKALNIPVIGIGSGPDTDGQVLVVTDMWGESDMNFKFLQKFGNITENKCNAVKAYAEAVRAQAYPSEKHSFHIKKAEKEAWSKF